MAAPSDAIGAPPEGVFGRRAWLAPALVLATALAVHLAWITHPLSVVFDEVHFGRYALDYLKPAAYFDNHPPLGKMIFGAMAALLGLDPGFSYAGNGLALPDVRYAWLRLPAHVAGVVFPALLFALARELGLSRWAAFVVGLLAALDNALLVISRTVQLDMFLLDSGFGALACYLRHRRTGGRGAFAAAALLAGVAVSIKWTGLAFVGIVGALEALRLVRTRDAASLGRLVVLAVVPAAVYLATFAIHFALLDRAGAVSSLGFVERVIDLHANMLRSNRATTSHHAYGSHWFDWPFMMRTVDFWASYRDPLLSRIYLLGNPVVWWSTGYAMLYLLVNFVPKLPALLQRQAAVAPAELLLVGAYLANMLPFVPITRVMFLYHYLPALGFALLALGLLIDRSGRHGRWLGTTLLVLAAAAFVYFAPLSYGLEITRAQFDARFWVDSWK